MSSPASITKDDLVLVTGATGYIAGFVVRNLLERGFRVRGTVRSLAKEEKRAHLVAMAEELKVPDSLDFVEADLSKDLGWEEAVAGCAGVFHMASPFVIGEPEDENELIGPAVEGTRRVLGAAAKAGGVRRVVLTSSCVSIAYGRSREETEKMEFTEEVWTPLDGSGHIDAYGKSKVLAERAAWDLVKELPEEQRFELAVVNPSYVQGPVFSDKEAASNEVLKRLLSGKDPGVADVGFVIVDVREVAQGHVQAMVVPEAAGHRHALTAGAITMPEIAAILSKEFGPKGYKVPTKKLPFALLWLLGRCDPAIKSILPELGMVRNISNKRAREVLGVEFRPLETTILEMASSLIEHGVVEKKEK